MVMEVEKYYSLQKQIMQYPTDIFSVMDLLIIHLQVYMKKDII